MKEITTYSDPNNLDSILSKIGDELEPHNIPIKSKLQLDLIVEELFINICNYAYDEKGEITINFCIEINPISIIIQFIDKGVQFNPLTVEKPDLTLNSDDRQIGGMGLTIVRKNADEMKYVYEDNQNILTIKKLL